jgi:hypothetical protein
MNLTKEDREFLEQLFRTFAVGMHLRFDAIEAQLASEPPPSPKKKLMKD